MKVMLMVTLLLLSTGVSRAQGLQDEDKALQTLNPANDLNIPPEICSMDVVMLRTRTSFCEFAKRFAIAGRLTKRYVALPMIRLQPKNQLVEMVGIPGRITSDGEVQSFVFKNKGGVLVLGGMLRNIKYSSQSEFQGNFFPAGLPEEDMDSLISQRMLIDSLGLK